MRAALFIPCLTDQLFPETGISMVRVLRHMGVEVEYRPDQTCCGQPAYNAGYREEAMHLATRFLDRFQDAEAVVAPSGSCVSMVRIHYGDLDLPPRWRTVFENIRGRVYEFTEFLTEVLGVSDLGGRFPGRITYHPGCHLLRELGIDAGPRKLLRSIEGLTLVEMKSPEACCGFGGTFSVKFPELSTHMVRDKCRAIQETGAEYVVSCDASCLMQIGGYLRRNRINVKPLHIADLLAKSLGL